MSELEIAKQLYENQENIILIYAFNATGKTRLSVAYKDHTKAVNNNTGASFSLEIIFAAAIPSNSGI